MSQVTVEPTDTNLIDGRGVAFSRPCFGRPAPRRGRTTARASDRLMPASSSEAVHQSHTDMSPGGYFAQFSVSLATTPLLFQKIFMWLGQATQSGAAGKGAVS